LKAKIDSTRLNQNIREIMRRNLRISITGIDFDEKQQPTEDYWPLQLQKTNSSLNVQHKERTATMTSTYDLPKTEESIGFNEQKDLIHRIINRNHITHV
jgi:hypothetical protein